jgi:transcriptional regulator with XRE-family HTH domain
MKIKDITPEKILSVRKSHNLTQADMAKELGVSERYLRYRETGDISLTALFSYAIIGFIKSFRKR